MDRRYDPLVVLALQHRFRGARNDYIRELLKELEGADTFISGAPERLVDCPCCGYLTLDRRGEYDICAVCFWEDDGSVDPVRYSSVNHMTLGEGREHFLRVGACEERLIEKVVPNGHRMFHHIREAV
ncbi:MAG: hypothetical protein IPK82_21715 [Polyangiaceae bacterium]|nr:hypothetical protein [Polyangiaceae bacterium]